MPSYLTPGVYVEEIPAQSKPIEGVGTSIAAFVGIAPGGPVNRPMRISNWTQFAKLYGDPAEPENGPFMPGAYLAHSVYGFFQNGGGVCWIVRVGGADGRPAGRRRRCPRPAGRGGELLRATAREGVTDQVSIEITPEAPAADAEEGKAEQATYRVVVTAGPQREEFDGLSLKKGRNHVVTKVNAGSALVTLEEVSGAAADAAPREGTYTLSVPAVEPVAVDPTEFEGDVAHRRGLGGLAAVDEITMLCIPDLATIAQGGDDTMFRDIQGKMIAHAEAREGPDRDPGSAARPAAAGRARVAHVRPARLEVRHALLPVARGDGPAHAAADHGAAVRPHGRRLGAHRLDPRRAQGARERGRAGRERARVPDHARGAGRPEPARASTASARSPAAASACGAPAPSRATPSGAT